MADYGMVLAWNAPRQGREMKALEVFAEAQGIYEKAVANGQIDSFETVLLLPSGGALPGGYTISWGTEDQIDAWARDDEYGRLQLSAGFVADGVVVTRCIRHAAITEGIGNYAEAMAAYT